MKSLSNKTLFWLFTAFWLLLNLACALFSEIHADEAYYRLYGQYLDWGYFDHPPFVGLMTWLSNILVHGSSMMAKNMAVRLCTVIIYVGTIVFTYLSIPRQTEPTRDEIIGFFLIAMSIVMFSVYGFITAPDSPLLLFAALFVYLYKRYLEKPEWLTACLLGVSMAGIIYSKYIGVLLILLVIASNPRLMRDIKLWIAVLVGVALMIPHFVWQIDNNFPTLTYHLVSRSKPWTWLYTAEYFPNQFLVFNPVAYILVWILTWHYIRSKDAFFRMLAFLFAGVQLFFFAMSLRGHVEPHWTMVASIAVIILLTVEWRERRFFFNRKWLRSLTLAMFCFVVLAHVVLCLNVLPERTGLANKKPFFDALHDASEGYTIVMDGSFQDPSLYRFFYDDQAVLVRCDSDRYTQFDLLHLDDELVGKPACVIRHNGKSPEYNKNGFSFPCRIVEHYSKEDMK